MGVPAELAGPQAQELDGSRAGPERIGDHGAVFRPDVSYESNDYNVMQSLVAAGMGVTLLPDLSPPRSVAGGTTRTR